MTNVTMNEFQSESLLMSVALLMHFFLFFFSFFLACMTFRKGLFVMKWMEHRMCLRLRTFKILILYQNKETKGGSTEKCVYVKAI